MIKSLWARRWAAVARERVASLAPATRECVRPAGHPPARIAVRYVSGGRFHQAVNSRGHVFASVRP
jgi:hypothetical protein